MNLPKVTPVSSTESPASSAGSQETQNAQEARRHRLQQPNRDDQSPDHGHSTEPQRDQRSGHMHAGKSRNDEKTGPDRTSPFVLQQAAAGRADHAGAHEVDFLVKARPCCGRNHDGVEQRDRQHRDVLQADDSEYRQRRSLIQPINQVVRSANDQPPVYRPSTHRRLTTTLSAASQPDTEVHIEHPAQRLAIGNEQAEVARAADWLDRCSQAVGLPPELCTALQIALDEVLTNILKYAYTDTARHAIELSVSAGPALVVLEVIDDGVPFDPTLRPPGASGCGVTQPQLGGHGLTILARLMDEVTYARRDGRNHLTLRKNVNPHQI
jgi:serine/threonine-protein kinase RsbW